MLAAILEIYSTAKKGCQAKRLNASDSATLSKKRKPLLKCKVFPIRNFAFGGLLFKFCDYFGIILKIESTLPLVLESYIIIFHYEEKTGVMEEHGGNFHHIGL